MKKTWNSPEVQELTIQATAWWGHGGGYGNGGHGNGGHGNGGHGNGGHGNGGHGNDGGYGNSNLCRCQGGTSPCMFHHFGEDLES